MCVRDGLNTRKSLYDKINYSTRSLLYQKLFLYFLDINQNKILKWFELGALWQNFETNLEVSFELWEARNSEAHGTLPNRAGRFHFNHTW